MAKSGQGAWTRRTAAGVDAARLLPAILMMLFSSPRHVADEIRVKVVDQTSMSGVASRVLVSRNPEQDGVTQAGTTDESGVLTVEHACSPGDQLFAEPLGDSHYRSEKESCSESLLLRVKRRPSPEDELVERSRSVIVVDYSDGTSREVVVEHDGVVNYREVSAGGMSGGFCYVKMTFKLNRDVYLVAADGAWQKDPSESSSETLVKDRTKTARSGSCTRSAAAPTYEKVKDLGGQRLRSQLDEDLQGLLSRLEKRKGVEAARLR